MIHQEKTKDQTQTQQKTCDLVQPPIQSFSESQHWARVFETIGQMLPLKPPPGRNFQQKICKISFNGTPNIQRIIAAAEKMHFAPWMASV